MNLLSIDDLDLADLRLPRLPLVTDESDAYVWQTRREEGSRGSVFIAGAGDTATYVVAVWCADTLARDDLIAALIVDVDTPRRVVAQRLDEQGTIVQTDAAITKIEIVNETDFLLSLEADDSVWREVTPTTVTKLFTTLPDRAMTLPLRGNTRSSPRIILVPTANRSSPTADGGWQYRQRWRITNNGDLPAYRWPIRIGFGDGSALVSAGKMLSTGRDLRVWLDGIEQPRAVLGPNTTTTYVWVVVPNLPPQSSLTYDLVYGNSAAANESNFAYPDTPVLDLVASANDFWSYMNPLDLDGIIRGDVPGIWWLSTIGEQAVPDYGVPAAWHPVRTRRNPDSKYASYARPYMIGFSQPEIIAYVNLAISHSDNIGSGDNDSIAASQLNGYDGVGFYSPWPVTTWTVDNHRWQNDNGIGRMVALGRESPATDWYMNNELHDTQTNTTTSHSFGGTAAGDAVYHEVAIAVWPINGWEIPDSDTPSGDIARLYTDATSAAGNVEVTFAIDDLAIAQVQPETIIYEWDSELALGGGESRVPPYSALRIGNARDGRGAGTPRAACRLTECLVIDPERATVEVWTYSGGIPVTYVERIPAAAVQAVAGWDNNGVSSEAPTNRWLSLGPRATAVNNADFGGGAGTWTAGTTTGGAFAIAWAADATVGGVAVGSLKGAASGTTASGAITRQLSTQIFPTFNRQSVDLVAWTRTDTTGLAPMLGVQFYADDAASVPVLEAMEANWTPSAAPLSAERAFSARVPRNAKSYRLVLAARATAANPTGNVWFDDLRLNGGALLFRDDTMGQVTVIAQVAGAWV